MKTGIFGPSMNKYNGKTMLHIMREYCFLNKINIDNENELLKDVKKAIKELKNKETI